MLPPGIRDELIDLRKKGYCVLKNHFAPHLIAASREAFLPRLFRYLEAHHDEPNRGANRHYVPMPFTPPCFDLSYFFDPEVLSIVHSLMGDKVVADQWGCDVALTGADYQGIHVDYRHPLFSELPDLQLPVYMLIVSFGLGPITITDGPIEIAPGTQNMQRTQALRAAESGEVELQAVPLEVGDVLIRHPWAIHRGSPNRSITARALVSIRYVRSWYDDKSRDVSLMPQQVWESLTSEQQNMMRFSVEGRHSPNVISF